MTPAEDVLTPLLADHVGAQVAGGCDDCDAYQTFRQDEPGVAPHRQSRRHMSELPPARREPGRPPKRAARSMTGATAATVNAATRWVASSDPCSCLLLRVAPMVVLELGDKFI